MDDCGRRGLLQWVAAFETRSPMTGSALVGRLFTFVVDSTTFSFRISQATVGLRDEVGLVGRSSSRPIDGADIARGARAGSYFPSPYVDFTAWK